MSNPNLLLPVNNAAWVKPGPALAITPDDLAKSFEVGVYAPLYQIQAAMPHMSRGGRIINIGSVASKLGLSGMAVYGATKAAIDALTYSLALEVGLTPSVNCYPRQRSVC